MLHWYLLYQSVGRNGVVAAVARETSWGLSGSFGEEGKNGVEA